MKKILFLFIMSILVSTYISAQNLINDNFNQYAVGTPISSLGYSGQPVAATGTIQAADAPGNNGTQFVKIPGSANDMNFKTPAITNFVVGHTYVFEMMTSVPSDKSRNLRIWPTGGTRAVIGGSPITALGWTKSSITFTLASGDCTSFIAGFTSSNNKTVDVYLDDLLLYDKSTAAVSNVNGVSMTVVKNLLAENFKILGSEKVQAYSICDLNGKQIKEVSDLKSCNVTVDLSNLSKGIYFLKILDVNSQVHIQKVSNLI